MSEKKKQLQTWLYSAAGVAGIFVIVVAANWILGSIRARVDLTESRLFTLSKGTRELIKSLDTPVSLRFYATGDEAMPVFMKAYARQVEDLLLEIKGASGGKIVLQKFDPKPDSDAADSAELDGVSAQAVELDRSIYLGLAASCLDHVAAVPFLSPSREDLLEYDIARLIAQVSRPKKAVIGVMSSLPVFGNMPNPMMMQMGQRGSEPWAFLSDLQGDFDVREIQPSATEIDKEVTLLVVVHPSGISEESEYAIDQFLMRGGRLLVFVDPMCLSAGGGQQQQMMMGGPQDSSTLTKLFAGWGITLEPGKVVADMEFRSIFNRDGGPSVVPVVLRLTSEALDAKDVITSGIDDLMLPFVGALSGKPAEGIQMETLIKSSRQSQLVDSMTARFSEKQILKDFAPSNTEYALAVRLRGKFKTAFPDGKPGEKKDADKKDGDKKDAAKAEGDKKDEGKKDAGKADGSLKECKEETAVIVVADSDFLSDQFSVRTGNLFGQRIVMPANGNLALVQNMVDQLGGDTRLIGVRSRGSQRRPFTRIQKMEAEAQSRYQEKINSLERDLEETEQRLGELQRGKKEASQSMILSPEQQAEVERFHKRRAQVRMELKQVRKEFRQDVESLETTIKWINIAGMPLLVAVVGVALALVARRREKAS